MWARTAPLIPRLVEAAADLAADWHPSAMAILGAAIAWHAVFAGVAGSVGSVLALDVEGRALHAALLQGRS